MAEVEVVHAFLRVVVFVAVVDEGFEGGQFAARGVVDDGLSGHAHILLEERVGHLQLGVDDEGVAPDFNLRLLHGNLLLAFVNHFLGLAKFGADVGELYLYVSPVLHFHQFGFCADHGEAQGAVGVYVDGK